MSSSLHALRRPMHTLAPSIVLPHVSFLMNHPNSAISLDPIRLDLRDCTSGSFCSCVAEEIFAWLCGQVTVTRQQCLVSGLVNWTHRRLRPRSLLSLGFPASAAATHIPPQMRLNCSLPRIYQSTEQSPIPSPSHPPCSHGRRSQSVSPDDDNLDSPPPSILIDPHGYISAHENASTAEAYARCGELLIRVTFWTGPPPRVSCFTVHCPTLPQESVPSAFGYLPKILNTVEDLVLFRFAISTNGGNEVRPHRNECFVYEAGDIKKRSSLHPILMPPYLEFSDREPVLLRGRGMFFVAILCRRPPDLEQFDVHLYNSKTRKWCTKKMQSPQEEFDYSYTSKAITIGGEPGSVGWVDLWHGILIYDVLLDNDYLRYIPLPSTVRPRKLRNPMLTRDIIVVNGFIKFLGMKTYMKVANSGYIPGGWEAAMWKLNISTNADSNWDEDCKTSVSEVSFKDDTGYAQLLQNPRNAEVLPANLNEGEDTEPSALMRFHATYPALSLHDDGVVHIMSRLQPLDDMAWMVSVDMKKHTLKGVAFFGNGRPVGYGFNFFESGISKHLTRNKGDMMQSDNDLLQKDVQPQSNAKGTRCRRRLNKA